MFKFKTKKSDEVKTSPLTKKSNAVAKATMFFATLIATMFCFAVTASADDDPLTVVNNLSTFIFGLIRAVGLIILAWGIVQVGLSFQTHDPSQRSNGFLTLAMFLIITKARCRGLTKARKLLSFAVIFIKTISTRKSLKFLTIWV